MNVLKAIATAYLKAVALLFVTGFIFGVIQEIYRIIVTRSIGISPRQFSRMKRNIRKHTTDYSSRIK